MHILNSWVVCVLYMYINLLVLHFTCAYLLTSEELVYYPWKMYSKCTLSHLPVHILYSWVVCVLYMYINLLVLHFTFAYLITSEELVYYPWKMYSLIPVHILNSWVVCVLVGHEEGPFDGATVRVITLLKKIYLNAYIVNSFLRHPYPPLQVT